MIKCVCRNIADSEIYTLMDSFNLTYTEAFRQLIENSYEGACGRCDEELKEEE